MHKKIVGSSKDARISIENWQLMLKRLKFLVKNVIYIVTDHWGYKNKK